MEDLLSLSRGPSQSVTCFNGYIINGYRFRVENHDKRHITQNSGVVVNGNICSEMENLDYYGVLTEIIELQYVNGRRVVLFSCKWFDVHDAEKGIKVDEYGFTSVNNQRLLKTNEPFVLANQASQVFYATDTKNKGWHVVLKTQPRDSYDVPMVMDDILNEDDDGEAYQQKHSFNIELGNPLSLEEDTEINWSRKDREPILVEVPNTKKKRKRGGRPIDFFYFFIFFL